MRGAMYLVILLVLLMFIGCWDIGHAIGGDAGGSNPVIAAGPGKEGD